MSVPTDHPKVLIVFDLDLLERATAKAIRRGVSRSEYVRALVRADLAGGGVGTMPDDGGVRLVHPAFAPPTLVSVPFEDPA